MSEPDKRTAVARVRIVVEFQLSRPWSPDETFENAYKSALSEVGGMTLKHIAEAPGRGIVGSPEVVFVVFEKKE